MKFAATYRFVLLLFLSTAVIVTACNKEDDPLPVPEETCTFAEDPECYCQDNDASQQCIDYYAEVACTAYDKSTMFIRWRNSADAGIFTWQQMSLVAGESNVFEISQPASNFYLPGALEPNFGAQILEFSNQPDYGGRNDSQPWSLYRNQRNASDPSKNWLLPDPVDGVTSKNAYFVSVSTRDAAGVETIVCPPPADATDPAGFRLNLKDVNDRLILNEFSTIHYKIDAVTGEVAVTIMEGDACTSFDRSIFYIRWRNADDAGIFTWNEMQETAAGNGIFTISQLAEQFFTADATVPNFGAQLLEFSNQPDYGGLNNGQPWPLYRNDRDSDNAAKGWLFDDPVNGVTSKTAYFVSVSTRDASGLETIVCEPPADVSRAAGFRLNLTDVGGNQLLNRLSKITYTIDTETGEVVVNIEEEDPCTSYNLSKFYIRWRNSTDAGIFTWEEMSPVDGQEGLFTISQPASNFYLEGADTPNFGAQILEFSNQPEYGGLNDGRRWALYRNQRNDSDPGKDWLFPDPIDGVTSKTAYYVSVSTRNSEGLETEVCPPPMDVTNKGGFRLNFNDTSGNPILTASSILTYVIDTNTGEVSLQIN